MYFSVTFRNANGQKKNTWEDWHLIPTTPPMIAPPEPEYNYVDIPGSLDGPLDLTGALSNGKPTFKNSSGTWQFYWVPQSNAETRVNVVRDIRRFLNGGRFVVSLEEDPGFYHVGRFSLSDVSVGKDPTKVTLKYQVSPNEYTAEDLGYV